MSSVIKVDTIQNVSGKKLVDFKNILKADFLEEIAELRKEVNDLAENFEFYDLDFD